MCAFGLMYKQTLLFSLDILYLLIFIFKILRFIFKYQLFQSKLITCISKFYASFLQLWVWGHLNLSDICYTTSSVIQLCNNVTCCFVVDCGFFLAWNHSLGVMSGEPDVFPGLSLRDVDLVPYSDCQFLLVWKG